MRKNREFFPAKVHFLGVLGKGHSLLRLYSVCLSAIRTGKIGLSVNFSCHGHLMAADNGTVKLGFSSLTLLNSQSKYQDA